MKRMITLMVAAVMLLSISIPAWADDTTPSPTPTPAVSKAVKNDTEKLQKELDKAEETLAKLQAQKLAIEQQIQAALQKVSDKAGKKSGSNPADRLAELEAKWKAELDKMIAHDKEELEKLNAEIKKWTEYTNKETAGLKALLAQIDTTLQNELKDLNAKLAKATTEAEKARIQKMIALRQKYADLRKSIVQKKIDNLNTLWAEKQKMWEQRKDFLLKRQAINLDFRTSMIDARRQELKEIIALTPASQVKPGDSLEAKIRARFETKSAELDKKIIQVKALIASLQAKLAQ